MDYIDIADLPKPLKLDLGGTPTARQGYIGVDIRSGVSQICADMRKLPFPDSCADAIYASHCLEHIYPEEVITTLTDWYRIMKPGGLLEIYVPDPRFVTQGIDDQIRKNENVRDKSLKEVAGLLIGHGTNPYDYHYIAFDNKLLNDSVEEAGFSITSTNSRAPGIIFDLGVQAIKKE